MVWYSLASEQVIATNLEKDMMMMMMMITRPRFRMWTFIFTSFYQCVHFYFFIRTYSYSSFFNLFFTSSTLLIWPSLLNICVNQFAFLFFVSFSKFILSLPCIIWYVVWPYYNSTFLSMMQNWVTNLTPYVWYYQVSSPSVTVFMK